MEEFNYIHCNDSGLSLSLSALSLSLSALSLLLLALSSYSLSLPARSLPGAALPDPLPDPGSCFRVVTRLFPSRQISSRLNRALGRLGLHPARRSALSESLQVGLGYEIRINHAPAGFMPVTASDPSPRRTAARRRARRSPSQSGHAMMPVTRIHPMIRVMISGR